MKLISQILAKFGGLKFPPGLITPKSIVSSKLKLKPSRILLTATVLIIMLVTWHGLGRFVFGKDARIKAAFESGQRMEIFLETGEVKGRVLQAEKETKEDIKNDAQKVAEKPIEPTQEKSQEPDSTPNKIDELAWIKEDYIGPRLPDEVLAELLGGETNKTAIVSETVSIKDISDKPIVVIIIKGMGLSSSSTREALELPKDITMGFSPYSPTLDVWVKKTKASGHEIVLNIPMETSDYHTDNPGPYSLLSQSSDDDNTTRLKMLLALTKDYSAVYTENNEVFTRSMNSIRPVLELLRKENKYFVYGGGYSNYSMIQVANSINYPILVNDLVIDDDISAASINNKLSELEKIAKEKGYVVAMAHPYPMTIRLLQAWLPKAAENGLVVSPVSLLLGKIFK